MAMNEPTTIRRWFQFSLKSLLLLIVVCAAALTWWRQRALIGQVEAARAQIAAQERELHFRRTVGEIWWRINVHDPRQQKSIVALRDIWWPRARFYHKRLLAGDGEGDLEAFLISAADQHLSVAFLTRGRTIHDTIVFQTPNPGDGHDATLDGHWLDWVVSFTSSSTAGDVKRSTRVYDIDIERMRFVERPPKPPS